MPEPLLLSLPPVRLDWPFRLDATAGIYGGRVIVPVDIAAFLRRAFRGNANEVTLCGVALSAFVSSITAAILILDEQTLLAMRTWLAGEFSGAGLGDAGYVRLVFSGGICVSPLPCTLP